MKNWTIEDLRSECRHIATAFSEHHGKPAQVGFDFSAYHNGDDHFSIHISVDGNIVEMDAVFPFSLLTAKVAKYKRLADTLVERSEAESRQLAVILGIYAP